LDIIIQQLQKLPKGWIVAGKVSPPPQKKEGKWALKVRLQCAKMFICLFKAPTTIEIEWKKQLPETKDLRVKSDSACSDIFRSKLHFKHV